MSNLLKSALEKERSHYSEKLFQIGVYNKEVMNKMTISELRKEYAYFFRSIANHKKILIQDNV
ncbi:stress protein [Bacillus subtilis]|nr:stress protein [Bacillus subtilis]